MDLLVPRVSSRMRQRVLASCAASGAFHTNALLENTRMVTRVMGRTHLMYKHAMRARLPTLTGHVLMDTTRQETHVMARQLIMQTPVYNV